MVVRNNAKEARRRPLYRSAKISEHRFRKVLWQFVLDRTATLAARETGLSANSMVAIFRKLRVYFTEVRLFTDFYEGGDPLTYESDDPVYEHALLSFHFCRVREKNGLRSPPNEPDYHFAESHWRYHFAVLMRERPSEQVHAMMLSHLIEIVRLCGPVGTNPANRQAGLTAVLRQIDQRIDWLERNVRLGSGRQR